MDTSYRRFVGQNIKQVGVKPHKWDEEGPRGRCPCGRSRFWEGHDDLVTEGMPTFDPEVHLTESPTTCYGNITFEDYEYDIVNTVKPFIRISNKTKPEDLLTIMTDHWGLPSPRLIISVTGGAQMFDLSNRHLPAFKRDLVKAATTADAWIITGGMESGVMSLVGEAICEHTYKKRSSKENMVAIGIASWSALDNKSELYGVDPQKVVKPLEPDRRQTRRVSITTQTSLDPNHSHFILVDDGTENQFGGEIALRALLERHISQNVHMVSGDDTNVPVVILVIEGGPGTIQTCLEGARRHTPIVILDGSGRAADLMAFAYNTKYGTTVSSDSGDFCMRASFHKKNKNSLKKKIRETLWITEEEKLDEMVAKLDELVSNPNLITIIPFGGELMDRCVFEALVKANHTDILTQLKLAMIWNFSDVATQELFGMEIRAIVRRGGRHPDELKPLHEAMYIALVHNRPEFVQMFMENGFNLANFLSKEKLADLYWQVLGSPKVGTAVWLIEEALHIKETDKLKLLQRIGSFINTLTQGFRLDLYQDVEKQSSEELKTFDEPERELFIWAVLLGSQDMAKCFWQSGRDPIAAAIVANNLLSSVAEIANLRGESGLHQTLTEQATEYENLAVRTMLECYKLDIDECHNLLTRELEGWNRQTVLTLANHARCMEFMQQPSVQTKMDKLWMGNIPHFVSLKTLWLCILCPLLSMFLIDFDFGRHRPKLEKHNSVKPARISHVHHNGLMNGTLKPQGKKKKYRVPKRLAYLSMFMTAPIVKFFNHTVSFFVHIILLCLLILTELDSKDYDPFYNTYETIVWIFSLTILVEEARQCFPSFDGGFRKAMDHIWSYLTDPWNLLDLTMLLFLLISAILRFTVSEKNFYYVQMCYTIASLLSFVRFLQIFFLSRKVGPLIVMVWEMIIDLVYFLAILLNIMLAYGVAQQAIHFPKSRRSFYTFWQSFYRSYWFFGQQTELEELNGDLDSMLESCSRNESSPLFPHDEEWERRCGMLHYSWLAIVLDGLYILIVNVLLMNLLIAMFAHTFKKVQKNSEKVWRYYRYGLIEEYFSKTVLPPPLNVISYLMTGISALIQKCCTCKKPKIHDIRHEFRKRYTDPARYKSLTSFEKAGLEEYLFTHSELAKDKDPEKLAIADLHLKLEKQSEELGTLSTKLAKTESKLNKKLKHIIDYLDRISPHLPEDQDDDL